MTSKLTVEERAAALPVLASSSWAHDADRDALTKTFKFKNFVRAWGWMTSVAIEAEKMNHHPEWFNVWNRVDIQLTTHDAGGISALDFELAAKIDALLA